MRDDANNPPAPPAMDADAGADRGRGRERQEPGRDRGSEQRANAAEADSVLPPAPENDATGSATETTRPADAPERSEGEQR
jgi:hypothetical protein